LAGFSVGGIAALEAARYLQQRGVELPGLILVDTVYPGRLLRGAFFWRTLGWLARRLNAQELSMNGRHLGAMFSDPGLVAQIEAMSDYKPERYSKPVLLMKTSGLIKWERLLFTPWRKFFNDSLREIQISGLHGSIFEKQGIQELAQTLSTELVSEN
jgi:thioesterase domain-containing protein